MVISAILTALLLYVAVKFLKEQRHKNLILKLSAVITVLIHYSDLLVEYLKNNGEAIAGKTYLLPVYPCNIVMWMLLVLAFIENKNGTVFRVLAEFCFVIGTVCGVIGILLNENFADNPTLLDYSIFKGLLSHSTMLFGCIYLYVGRYVKFGIFNTVSMFFGFSVFVICGIAVNLLHTANGMEAPDGIWIEGVPYVGVSSIILGLLFILAYFGVFALIELRLPPEERWYSKIKVYFSEKKNKN
jgi:hypothetical protein